ncbi:MAG TPA: hypothetical protein PKH79_06235 [Prolixibacteraceae bacterium]|nr:hypothetical protein [Prolixibacteraceae bacterium]
MKIQTGISSAGLFLVIIIAIVTAVVYFVYLYKKDRDEFSDLQRYVLSGVRLTYLFLISFLLLSPLIEIIKTRYEKPLLIIGVDNSESIATDSSYTRSIREITKDLQSKVSNKFDLNFFTFGEKVQLNSTPDFKDKISNYSDFIDEIDNRYFNLNVGAIVMIGDGIYNEGKNPDQMANRLSAPIYTIGFGDTLARKDQLIINISHNENVFIGNSFPVEIEASFSDFPVQTTQLQVNIGDNLVYSEVIDVPQPNFYFSKTINLKAEKKGFQNVSVLLTPFADEQNTTNNRSSFTIEVHENKYHVLFLTQGPHPDIGALSSALTNQANFEISVVDIQNFKEDLNKYNLVVLNQLPSLSLQQLDIFKKIASSDQSVLLLVGPNSSISALNNLEIGYSMTPSTQNQESFPYFDESYSHFTLPTNMKNVSDVYPPLLTFFTQYQLSKDYSVIAFQKINGIEMNYPMIATGEVGNRKIGVVCGEGIWRWRLSEFQNFDNQESFDQLFVNLFNYLCLKEVREQFRVEYKRITPEILPVHFNAQVFNDIFQPITISEVKLTLTDSTNAELSFLFDANQQDYNLNVGYLAPGKYHFTASTKVGEKEFSKSGDFVVQKVEIENQNQRADFKLLNSLSERSGGKFFHAKNGNELADLLNQNQNIKIQSHKEKNIHEMIDWKLYFFIIFLLFSLEWFLRKFWGSY